MLKKKIMIPFIFALVLLVAMFSGCVVNDEYPIVTSRATDYYHLERVELHGYWSLYCNMSDPMFVVDNESHLNWEDYYYRFNATILEHRFRYFLNYGSIPDGEYYVRAVGYCYDFRGKLEDFEEGWYQGEELFFYLFS